jgi:hypothetical protein
MGGVRRHFSYANVMATIAVFIALGGGAYALSLPKNSVKSKNIAKRAVKARHIAKKAVKARHIAAGAVGRNAIADGAIDSAKVQDGSLLGADFGAGQISDAAVHSGSTSTPPAYATTFPVESVTLNIQRPGKLLVVGSATPTVNCSGGGCSDVYGLYVDHQPVPFSAAVLSSAGAGSVTRSITLLGVTSTAVAAGSHTLELQFAQGTNSSGPSIPIDSKVAALLLGP